MEHRDRRELSRRRDFRRARIELDRVARCIGETNPVIDGIQQRRAVPLSILRKNHWPVKVFFLLRRIERRELAELADRLPVKSDGTHAPVDRLLAEIFFREFPQRHIVMIRVDGTRVIDAVLDLCIWIGIEFDFIDDSLRVLVPGEQRRICRRLCFRRLPKPCEPFAHRAFCLFRPRPDLPAARDGSHDKRQRREHRQPLLPRPLHRDHLAFAFSSFHDTIFQKLAQNYHLIQRFRLQSGQYFCVDDNMLYKFHPHTLRFLIPLPVPAAAPPSARSHSDNQPLRA